MNTRRQRGQALILIALAFIGLASFIGLAVDAGILFSAIGHLRRAVDAAALAAANQFREDRSLAQLRVSATEFISLNAVSDNPADVDVNICTYTPDFGMVWGVDPENDALCPDPDGPGPMPPTGPDRKFVEVEATLDVDLAFLRIIGFNNVPIRAEATSEAASLDIVLVIDTSSSMTFELCRDGLDNDEDGHIDDCNGGIGDEPAWEDRDGDGTNDGEDDPLACTLNRDYTDDGPGDDPAEGPPPGYPWYDYLDGDIEDNCHPFEEVRDAALGLVDRMYFPYDRISIVTFAATGSPLIALGDGGPVNGGQGGDNENSIRDCLEVGFGGPCSFDMDGGGPLPGSGQIEVSLDPLRGPGNPCNPPAVRGCTNTNTAEGMLVAGNIFGDPNLDGTQAAGEIRSEAVWIVILLTDGGANAARTSLTAPENVRDSWICPPADDSVNVPTHVQPLCRDPYGGTRPGNFGYDADDAARDAVDFVGCPDANSQPDNCTFTALPGQGAIIFSIGLGPLVVNSPGCYAGAPYFGVCEVDLGEKLLRYAAAVGDDGDPSTDLCGGIPSQDNCGNYFFSPTGAGLRDVFEAIASRIFTRLTH
jgi:Putative Flp pilus-assembly TadE/G-like